MLVNTQHNSPPLPNRKISPTHPHALHHACHFAAAAAVCVFYLPDPSPSSLASPESSRSSRAPSSVRHFVSAVARCVFGFAADAPLEACHSDSSRCIVWSAFCYSSLLITFLTASSFCRGKVSRFSKWFFGGEKWRKLVRKLGKSWSAAVRTLERCFCGKVRRKSTPAEGLKISCEK